MFSSTKHSHTYSNNINFSNYKMKTTNAIETALIDKANNEIDQIVDRFIQDIKINITAKYRSRPYSYFFKSSGADDADSVFVKDTQLKSVLTRALRDQHIDRMVQCKSAELINKLNLDI